MTFQPTREQQAIIEFALEPLRVAAGAGTGKTTTIAHRVRHAVENLDVGPDRVLGLTFTNKAAGELADRIRTTIPDRELQPVVQTYHGFAASLLREFGALVGIERGAEVVNPTSARQLLLDLLRSGRFELVDIRSTRTVVPRLLKLAADLSDNVLTSEDLVQAAPASSDPVWQERLELATMLRRFGDAKRRLGLLDYGDLIRAAVQLVSDHPTVGGRLRSRFDLVLLDEYQDTNPGQRLLLMALFGEGFPVTAVGDSAQTIYEWRGASVENFEGFATHFPGPDGTPSVTLPLSVNRRSGPAILRAANHVRSLLPDDAANLVALTGADEATVDLEWFRTSRDEARWIAAEMRSLHDAGTPWREMAVLFRKNKDIAMVRDVLTDEDIPVEVANLGGLLDVPEIVELHAWLRVLGDPGDAPALARVLMGSRYRLGMTDIAPLSHWLRAQPSETAEPLLLEAFDHLHHIEGHHPALDEFADLYRRLLATAQAASIAELVREILDETGAWFELDAMPPTHGLTARLNVYRFIDLAESWSPLEGRPSLPAFLDHLALMAEDPVEELDTARLSSADAVSLLTIHRAKGLEWDAVFLPSSYHQNFPARVQVFEDPFERAHILPLDLRIDAEHLPELTSDMPSTQRKNLLRERHLQQEWRIAYVGITRARSRLAISGSYWHGQPVTTKPAKPSLLLEHLAQIFGPLQCGEPGERPDTLRPPLGAAPDPLFVDGWQAALAETLDDPHRPRRLAEQLDMAESYEREVEDYRQLLLSLPETLGDHAPERLVTSVTGLVTYATCPKQFFWKEIDRLPRRPSQASRRGVEVHRRIELHHLGMVPLTDFDTVEYDDISGDDAGTGAWSSFLSSRFAVTTPRSVETAFSLQRPAGTVRGRVDAIFGQDHWEIVDYKSGRPSQNPARLRQLQAYAMAAMDGLLGPPPDDLTVTFAYLGGGLVEEQHRADSQWMITARLEIDSALDSIAAEEFGPEPGPACRSCDFLPVCDRGQAWVSAAPEEPR